MQRAAAILHAQGTVAVPAGYNLRISLLAGPGVQMQSAVDLAAQVSAALHAQQAEVVLHGYADGPAHAAGVAAIAHLAGKGRHVVRHQKPWFITHKSSPSFLKFQEKPGKNYSTLFPLFEAGESEFYLNFFCFCLPAGEFPFFANRIRRHFFR
jgi:hypothetical protein